MSSVFHLLTGEYPPDCGGVGDYTQIVAEALAARGSIVHVWSPAVADGQDGAVVLHALPDSFGPRSRELLSRAIAAEPGCVLLQYVPNALGRRGTNLAFCLWLRKLGTTTDVRVMFHEPYFYFAWQQPWRNALAVAQRAMAAALMQACSVAYFSTDAWRSYLASWASSRTRIFVTPIPTTSARRADASAVDASRTIFTAGQVDAPVVGHFGTYGEHVSAELLPVLDIIVRSEPRVRCVCLGRGSDRFVESLPAEWRQQITASGTLSRTDLAAALRACDVLVQPYPDGVTTRRTSVMAGLANGVATVTTSGELTEDVWAATSAVALAPAGDPAGIAVRVSNLLCDPTARRALGDRGRQTYDAEFALDRTINALLDAAAEPARA